MPIIPCRQCVKNTKNEAEFDTNTKHAGREGDNINTIEGGWRKRRRRKRGRRKRGRRRRLGSLLATP